LTVCAGVALATLGGRAAPDAPPAAGVRAAAAFAVNSTLDAADSSAGDGSCESSPGVCTLRAAIQEANASPGPDVIALPAGTYTLTIEGRGEDNASTGDLDVTGDLTINGSGAASTVVQACAPAAPATTCAGIDRVFHVDPAGAGISAAFNRIAIRNGTTTLISFVNPSGGGVLLGVANTLGGTVPSGMLTLTEAIVAGNASAGPGFGAPGGGVANRGGTLVVLRSTIAATPPSAAAACPTISSAPSP
jgi:CSLREA domain-containing protein